MTPEKHCIISDLLPLAVSGGESKNIWGRGSMVNDQLLMITRVSGGFVRFNSCGGHVPGCALKGQPSWPVGSTRNPAQGRATPPPGRSGTLGERPPPPPAPPLLRSSPGPAMQSRGRIAGARGAGDFRLVPVPQGAAPLRVALPWAGLICPFGAHPGGFNYP